MRASVIVVNYNNREDLQRGLPSLLSSLGEQDELIVVDNASTDCSATWLAETYPQARLVSSRENLGFAGGNNLGAAHASGKYLACLNPDTQVEPGWLDALVMTLENDPGAGMATSKILLLNDPERINTCGNEVHLSGITLCRGMSQPRQAYPNPEEVSAVSGAAFVIRKELFEALGGFDERFFLYMEDTDLSWRARLAGYRCLYVPASVVYHDYTLTFGPLKSFYQERNRYLMLLKCLHWRTLLALLPALLFAELVTWGFVLLKDRQNLANKIRAYAWIARHWNSIHEQHKSLRCGFQHSDRILLKSTTWRLEFSQTQKGVLVWLVHLVFDPLFYVSKLLLAGFGLA